MNARIDAKQKETIAKFKLFALVVPNELRKALIKSIKLVSSPDSRSFES